MKSHYTAHILSHTHWDREWYLNSPYTNEWLIPFFDGLFTMLENEPDYKFILDGQLSMIEDYFEELSKQGKSVTSAKEKIQKHVERKALSIGPYYLQPDWQLLSEESLVRNMLVGNKLAKSLGGSMKSGWLLDNFGQISQTAQIHALSEITGLFVWRGVSMDPHKVQSEFIWESPDGTKMVSVYLLNSYRNVMRLAEYSEIMHERMEAEVEKLKPFAATSNLLMMNGYDQEMIPDDIQPLIKRGLLDGKQYKTIQNDPDNYIRAILSENPDLPTLKGALYDGRFISVFPGVLSSRMYLKLQNDQMQRLLEKKLEPLALFSWISGDEYGGNQIEQAWKILLKNHPHDSICGVSIDDVHKDMEQRNRQVFSLAQSLLEDKLSYLAGAIDTTCSRTDEAFIIFNTAPFMRSGIVPCNNSYQFVSNIPGFGYKVLTGNDTSVSTLKLDEASRTIEHSNFLCRIEDNGSFSVTVKSTGKQYSSLGVLEDMGDSGDEYNYSYPDYDKRILSDSIQAQIELVEHSEALITYKIFFTMDIPEQDIDKHTKRSEETLQCPIVTYISVIADLDYIACKTVIKNTARDHRMRVLFNTGFPSDTALASSPFDITERPVRIPEYCEDDIPMHVKKVIVGAREASPSTFFHTRDFVSLYTEHDGFTVLQKGLPEYQIIEQGTIALTLFRSVGWIAKEINTRIGDAGPEIYTPDAQCLREMTFEYAVYPHTLEQKKKVPKVAEMFTNELLTVKTTKSAGVLPPLYSWMSLDKSSPEIRITGTKRSEDGKAIIIRGVNLSEEKSDLILTSNLAILAVERVNLLENPMFQELTSRYEFSCLLNRKEIFTLKITFAADVNRLEQPVKTDILIQDLLVKEDFSEFPFTAYVTEDDIVQEKLRAEKLQEHIEEPYYRRSALEAQLSVILTEQRRAEERIRALGYQLNEARVQRRIHDYIHSNISLKK